MKEICGSTLNIVFAQGDETPLVPLVEVVVIVAEPQYRVDDAGQLVKHRTTETIRFTTGVSGLRKLSKDFLKWADEAEQAVIVATQGPKDADEN